MRGHPRLAGAAHAVAFLGLGENDRGLTLMRLRCVEGRIELAEIVPAALQRVDFCCAHVRH